MKNLKTPKNDKNLQFYCLIQTQNSQKKEEESIKLRNRPKPKENTVQSWLPFDEILQNGIIKLKNRFTSQDINSITNKL